MNLSDVSGWLDLLDQQRCPLRIRFGGRASPLDAVLRVQSIDLEERLNGGVHGHVTCVSRRADLPLQAFQGVPLSVQIVNARGGLRTVRGVVRQARRGESDGGLTLYQLELVDPLTLLQRRVITRIFRHCSVVGLTRAVLDDVVRSSPTFGLVLDTAYLLDDTRYPQREFWLQANESVHDFLVRHWKRAGISWFFRPAAGHDTASTLVLVDDPMQLAANAAGEVRYHRMDGTETADALLLWSQANAVRHGSAARQSWDYKSARMAHSVVPSRAQHGAAGDELAAFLQDARIDPPHAGDSLADFERLTAVRIDSADALSAWVDGLGSERDMAVGEYNAITGHPSVQGLPLAEREHVVVQLHHQGENNLGPLSDRARTLADRSRHLTGRTAQAPWALQAAASLTPASPTAPRYLNRFVMVRRGAPIAPPWTPQHDLPRLHPMTAIVVAPDGGTVLTDELGRVKVRFVGAGPAVWPALGATSDTAEDHEANSAWLRFALPWAGNAEGVFFPLKDGMEVAVDFEQGDPDRPVITRVVHNGQQPPPRFSDAGSLPGNRHLGGIHVHEIDGAGRYGELVFDMTTGQINTRLASEHAQSQLLLGELRTPRQDGRAQPLGEGFYLRTDASGSIRTARSLLLSAWKRLDATGHQLSADEHVALMQDCLGLFKSLGDHAAQHHGLAADSGAQGQLHADVMGAAGGSNVDPQSPDGQPTISLSAPAGIATTTPKTLLSYAGVNIDSVAQQHLQCTAGQRVTINAGQGIGLFAQGGGIRQIAHQGTLLMQSQHADIEANAATDIRWTATNGKLVGMAKQILLVAEDGSFVQIGDGVTLGTQGLIAQKASEFKLSGPATLATALPDFAKATADQRFVLRYGGPTAPAAASTRYEITMSDGSTRAGISDAEGRTELLQSDAMHIAHIRIVSDDE